MPPNPAPLSVPRVVLVLVALLALASLSWWASHVPLGRWASPIALTIASCKGLLIAGWFVGLVRLGAAHRIAVITAVVLILILVWFVAEDVIHLRG